MDEQTAKDFKDFYDQPATPKQMNWVRALPDGERQAYELISEGDARKGSHV